MASEDSDELVPGLLPVHRLSDLRDLDETFCRLVSADGDEFDAAGELLEVLLLRTLHRILMEERNDRLQQILTTTHGVAEHVLPVVVIPPVRDHITDTEELTQTLETRDAGSTLRHCEFVRYLETGSVADSARPAWLPNETDRETPFSVYETDHPTTELDQPFLLVFRTRHVVTMVNALSDVNEVVRDTPGFPAYSQMRTVPLLARGATYSSADTALSIADTIP
jgi:hypothetical protein